MNYKKQNLFANFHENRIIFLEGTPPPQEVQDENLLQSFENADNSYKSFDDRDLSSIENQLKKYDSSWIENLPSEKKAEASRQSAYCLFMRLGVKRADEHNSDNGLGMQLALQSPKSNREFGENKIALNEIQTQLTVAISQGDSVTSSKAEKLSSQISTILDNMQPPKTERKEIRASFRLSDYLSVSAEHEGWGNIIDLIKISLSEKEEMNLMGAGQEGYSLRTAEDFNGRAGGNLILLKNGSSTQKILHVHGFPLMINGFSIN